MEVHFFERKFNESQISIEKLFGNIQTELTSKGIDFKIFKNPFPLSRMLLSMWYFRKRQGQINHITGDIHWACLLLNSNHTILTIHDLVGLEQLSGFKRKIYYLLWVYLPIKKLKYITTISQKTKDEIIKYLPTAKNKISLIPNCVTMDVVSLDFKKNEIIKKILIVGTRSNKNIDRILSALENFNLELIIVGELSKNQIEFLEHRIKYQNYINISDAMLTKLYDEANILCFPSLYEGFGLPILEAQARNCLVITSARSPMKEVAGNGALFVHPENINDIKNAIQNIIEKTEVREKLLSEGHNNVLKYSKSKISQAYVELYQKVLSAEK